MTSIAGLIIGVMAIILAWLPSAAGFLVLGTTTGVQYILLVTLGPDGEVLLWPELCLAASGLLLSGGSYWEARRNNAGTDLAVTGLVTNGVAIALVLLRLAAWGVAALAQLV